MARDRSLAVGRRCRRMRRPLGPRHNRTEFHAAGRQDVRSRPAVLDSLIQAPELLLDEDNAIALEVQDGSQRRASACVPPVAERGQQCIPTLWFQRLLSYSAGRLDRQAYLLQVRLTIEAT